MLCVRLKTTLLGIPARQINAAAKIQSSYVQGARPAVLESHWFQRSSVRLKTMVQSTWRLRLTFTRSHVYFLREQDFSIGMETVTHAAFCASISSHIERQLGALASHQDADLSEFTSNIRNCGSGRIPLSIDDQELRHSPDTSFMHRNARSPRIIFEVAHSQPKEELARLAAYYLLGAGDVQCVVGLKIAYSTGEQATLSVWERELTASDDGGYEWGGYEWGVKHTVEDLVSP